jgi:hypothetical protein
VKILILMKKTLLTLSALVCLFISSNAQTTPAYKRFNFSTAKDTYVPLSSTATLVNFVIEDEEEGWDDEFSDPIMLPFKFYYQNKEVKTVVIDTYGGLIFDEYNIWKDVNNIWGFQMDYAEGKDKVGKIYYETIGSEEGKRKFVVEFKNLSTFNNFSGQDTVNFQIILHEGTNIIEYKAGYCNIPKENFATSIDDLMSETKELLLSGLISNEGDTIISDESESYGQIVYPDLASSLKDTLILSEEIWNVENLEFIMLPEFPKEGTIFRFTPIPDEGTSIKPTILAKDLKFYPNPFTSQLTIESNFDGATYAITNIQGQTIQNGTLSKGNNSIQLNTIAQGQYLLKVSTNQVESTYSIIKN